MYELFLAPLDKSRVVPNGVERRNDMKEKMITLCLFLLYTTLALVVCAVGLYWFMVFTLNDIVNYYCGGILRFVFLLIILIGITLPILKYRKHGQKWVLPTVLIIILLLTPIFNNGILKIAEDDLRIFSREKWEQNEHLRIYMLDDLETHYLHKATTVEHVIELLGEPDFVSGDNSQRYEYFAGSGFMDSIMFYVQFENGFVVETGKLYT